MKFKNKLRRFEPILGDFDTIWSILTPDSDNCEGELKVLADNPGLESSLTWCDLIWSMPWHSTIQYDFDDFRLGLAKF